MNRLIPGLKLEKPEPIFPRLDLTKTADADEVSSARESPVKEPASSKPQAAAKAPNPSPKMNSNQEKSEAPTELIDIADFAKVQLKIARIFEAQPLEGSDKLMKLQVHIGEEKRQIIAGIRANYGPEDLIGRQIVVVANLKPAKLRGAESQGMLLAAVAEDGGAILLQPDRETPEGAKVR